MPHRWRGVIGREGTLTGDGRWFEPASLKWDTTINLPLGFVAATSEGHAGAVTIGRFETIERRPDGTIYATGTFTDQNLVPEARHAAYLIAGKFAAGISMDLDKLSFELRVPKELMEPMEVDDEELKEDDDGRVILMEMSYDETIQTFTSANIRGGTLVSKPAFQDAWIEVVDEDGNVLTEEDFENIEQFSTDVITASTDDDCGCVILASSVPAQPTPASWFEMPAHTEAYGLTVDGRRIHGYIAPKGCHTQFSDRCFVPPPADSYDHFHSHTIVTDNDEIVQVGVLTYRGGHADIRSHFRDAMSHYDDPSTIGAYGRAGHTPGLGYWFAGVIADDLEEQAIRALQTHPPSIDIREVAGKVHMIGVCLVNSPGFAPPRLKVSNGAMTALIASPYPRTPQPPDIPAIAAAVEAHIRLDRDAHDMVAAAQAELANLERDRLVNSINPQ